MATGVTVGNSGNRSVPTIHIGNGGTKRVLQAYVGTPGGNETVFFGLEADVTPATATAPVDGVQTNSVLASSPGGKAPLNYSWSQVSGAAMTISSASAASVFWTVPTPRNASSTWRCTITDGHGSQSSVDVSVNFSTNN